MTNLQYNNPKDELNLIEDAVRGLEHRAEELKHIQGLIEKLSQMGAEFKEEGKNINKAGSEFIETTKQCKELLGVEFNNLKDSYKEDSDSLNNHIIKWSKIVHDAGESIDRVVESIEKIDRVDFPSRLDKVDVTIASINQAIQNLQLKIENFEMNNKEFLKEKMQLIIFKQDQVFKKIFQITIFQMIVISIILAVFKYL